MIAEILTHYLNWNNFKGINKYSHYKMTSPSLGETIRLVKFRSNDNSLIIITKDYPRLSLEIGVNEFNFERSTFKGMTYLFL